LRDVDGPSYEVAPDRVFLTAEWRFLAMLNYEVDAGLLLPFVPAGTELDRWNGKVFVSLVGFRFLKTKVFGLTIPFHSNFDEVNLRFYVRRREGDEVRRGVVFLRDRSRRAIALAARTFYNENYIALRWRTVARPTTTDWRWRIAGEPGPDGARSGLKQRANPNSLTTALMSSSLPNTIGATPLNRMVAAWNIG
jgi:uncharacterized protein YqjF (DUF2071 family)